jgi:hypothetical protein
VRDALQRVALTNRRYGYRRIAAQLRRDGFSPKTSGLNLLSRPQPAWSFECCKTIRERGGSFGYRERTGHPIGG